MSALLAASQARVAMLWSNHGDALLFGSQAVASGVPVAVVQGRIAVGITQIKTGDLAAGLDQLRQARAECATLPDPDPDLLLVSYINLACGLRLAGSLDESIKVNLEGHELANVLGEGRGRGDLMLANAAEAEFALGRWERASCLAGQITGRASDPIAVRAAQRLLGRIATQRDPLAARLALAAAADGVAAGHSRPASSVDTRIAQAELALWSGDVATARRILISAWETVRGTGEEAHSGHLLALLARTGSCPQQVCLAPLPEQQAHARQRAAESTDDPNAWQAATAQWAELSRPFQAAYCGWRWAAALLTQARSTAPLPTQARPSAEHLTRPQPERLTQPQPERLTRPQPERLTQPQPERLTQPQPDPEHLTRPHPEHLTPPHPERITQPQPDPERLTRPRSSADDETCALRGVDARGRLLNDSPLRHQVQQVLAAAAHQASALGACALLTEIEALARLHRLPLWAPAASAQAPAFGLTSREAEVLAWITAGWSNRQIGEKLFISPKTVSVHISNILRKLDVNSRYEAAEVARHHGVRAEVTAADGV